MLSNPSLCIQFLPRLKDTLFKRRILTHEKADMETKQNYAQFVKEDALGLLLDR